MRRDESNARRKRIDSYSNQADSNLHPHKDLQGAFVYRPIVDLTTDEVWDMLAMGLTDQVSQRVLFTNSETLPEIMRDRSGFVAIRGSDLDRLTAEDFEAMRQWLHSGLVKLPRKQPRPHQQEALSAIARGLADNDRATVVMACGTGKSLMALWAAEHQAGEKLLVLVPSLALVRQLLHEWLRETALEKFTFMCVCSDPTVAKDPDDLIVHQADWDFPVTTDSAVVRRFLSKPFDGVKIIFSTYQSARVVAEGLPVGADGVVQGFDLGIFDEAHKTASREGRSGAKSLTIVDERSEETLSMEVFCNFRAVELELEANASHGARALKHFLKYAETGVLDILKETGKPADSPFEMEVMQALEERGYHLEAQVGAAGYFIDIAVKDPDFPGRYILAIECDGASYHSSRSALDRDRLRQGVLESLGWRFHRIWSTDWFRDSRQEIERTVASIEAARNAMKLDKPMEVTIRPVSVPIINRVVVEKEESATTAMAYRKAVLPLSKSGQALHEVPANGLALLVKSVIDIETPVHEPDIAKRLMDAFGVGRAGSRITESVWTAIKHGHQASLFHYLDGFIYADEGRGAKVRNRGALEFTERKIELIAPEELDAALLDVVRMGYSISQEAAVSGALDMLGFGRTSANIASVMNSRVESLLNGGRIKCNDDRLVTV